MNDPAPSVARAVSSAIRRTAIVTRGCARGQAIKRTSRPMDVAGAVAWFAFDRAGLVSAQTLVVDGGLVRLG